MPTYVALLRGINVGGQATVPMDRLRAVVAGLGHHDVRSYIQSGNLVFTSRRTDPTALAGELERAVAANFSATPTVLVLTRADLTRVVQANPYPAADPKRLHAVFLAGPVTAQMKSELAAAQAAAAAKASRDTARLVGRTVYLHTPDGYGRSELAARLFGRARTPPYTARNWATVTKLVELSGS